MGKVWMAVALGAVTVMGCGDDTVSPSGGGAPAHCDPSQRMGTYLATYTTVSGNCGDIASGLIMFGGSTPGETCIVDDQTIDASGCKIDSTRLSGEFTVTQTSPVACFGTYDVTYVRQ